MPNTKIATCTYCGTRAALVLSGQQTHELACASCGAPLHDLKQLRADKVKKAKKAGKSDGSGRRKHRDLPPTASDLLGMIGGGRPKKRKKRKRLLSEAFDLIEDIFD